MDASEDPKPVSWSSVSPQAGEHVSLDDFTDSLQHWIVGESPTALCGMPVPEDVRRERLGRPIRIDLQTEFLHSAREALMAQPCPGCVAILR